MFYIACDEYLNKKEIKENRLSKIDEIYKIMNKKFEEQDKKFE